MNGVGNDIFRQSMIVRFEDIQINRWKGKLNLQQTRSDDAWSKKDLLAEIKHYETRKQAALCALGKMVYEPVISIINAQGDERQRQQQQQNVGGRKKRTKRRRKRKGRSKRKKEDKYIINL